MLTRVPLPIYLASGWMQTYPQIKITQAHTIQRLSHLQYKVNA